MVALRSWIQFTASMTATALLMGPVGPAVAAQTFVQVPELSPERVVGPRITETIAMNRLNRHLFGSLNAKVTFVDALLSPPRAYEFSSDAVWSRVLFGEKDEYIYPFTNAGSSTLRLLAPAGVDISANRTLFIADQLNGRVVLVRFSASTKSLTQVSVTAADPDLGGVVDVAWDGSGAPLTTENFFALDGAGRVSYWTWTGSGAPAKQWVTGSNGVGQGEFNGPSGICVGRAVGSSGGSVFTLDFYIADKWNKRVVQMQQAHPPFGPVWVRTVSLPNAGEPSDCTVDHFGNVIVADIRNSRLLKFTSSLELLSQYGSYGVGAVDNTFANPTAVHVPFGTKRNGSGQTIWYGEGRVLTAETWSAGSGAREHYLGIDGAITAQPQTDQLGDAWFSYRTTDHAYHTFSVSDVSGNTVRRVPPTVIFPPGTRTWMWDGLRDDGTPAPTGTYWMQVTANSSYGCSGQAWCQKGLSTQTFFHQAGGGCEGPCSPPVAGELTDSAAGPSTFFLRQRVVGAPSPLTRLATPTEAPNAIITTSPGSLAAAVRKNGVRGLSIGVPRRASGQAISIRVYSLAGRPIRTLVNDVLQPGYYELAWDGHDDRGEAAAPGVYFAVLTAGGQRLVQRLILRQAP